MDKTVCDICGAETDGKDYWAPPNHTYFWGHLSWGEGVDTKTWTERRDLCPNCVKEVKEFICEKMTKCTTR